MYNVTAAQLSHVAGSRNRAGQGKHAAAWSWESVRRDYFAASPKMSKAAIANTTELIREVTAAS